MLSFQTRQRLPQVKIDENLQETFLQISHFQTFEVISGSQVWICNVQMHARFAGVHPHLETEVPVLKFLDIDVCHLIFFL